jgi:hypothetical protein
MADVFDLVYGEPGSAKTRSYLEVIKKINKETGKIARVYIGDGSYTMYKNSGLIKSGVVQAMEFATRDNPFTVCQQITGGFWPADPLDPKSKMVQLTAKQVEETGLWIFEGGAVMGNYLMGTVKGGLAWRAANGEVIGQEANIAFRDDPDHKFGGNPLAHYNVGQRHLLSNVVRSKGLPGIVVWTTHERLDDGERGGGKDSPKSKVGDKVVGPEFIGKAMTVSISREFGNTLHFTIASKKVVEGKDTATDKSNYVEKMEYRVYTRDHYDPDGVVGYKYKAVVRAMDPSKVKDYYVSEKPGEGLIKLYEDLELSNQ